MRITSKTTIEEYEAWLSTFPTMKEIAAAVRAMCSDMYKACDRIISSLRNKSCTSGAIATGPRIDHTIMPLDYNRNIAMLSKKDNLFQTNYLLWRSEILKRKIMQALDDNIGMEQALHSALEILSGKETN
jgi:hypothetical protein